MNRVVRLLYLDLPSCLPSVAFRVLAGLNLSSAMDRLSRLELGSGCPDATYDRCLGTRFTSPYAWQLTVDLTLFLAARLMSARVALMLT